MRGECFYKATATDSQLGLIIFLSYNIIFIDVGGLIMSVIQY